MSKYSIKSCFFQVIFKHIRYKEFQVFFNSVDVSASQKVRVFLFVRQIFQCNIHPKTVITFNNCLKSSGNLNLVQKHIMTSL